MYLNSKLQYNTINLREGDNLYLCYTVDLAQFQSWPGDWVGWWCGVYWEADMQPCPKGFNVYLMVIMAYIHHCASVVLLLLLPIHGHRCVVSAQQAGGRRSE